DIASVDPSRAILGCSAVGPCSTVEEEDFLSHWA
ncbi:hypothetical protein A2U01_0062833, partial [Trifolium medium]|nr:hypothetical protein [Trifolium medium]